MMYESQEVANPQQLQHGDIVMMYVYLFLKMLEDLTLSVLTFTD